MKGHEYGIVINYGTNRHLFARHGMHLNKTRKGAIPKHITATCVKIFQPKKVWLQFVCPEWNQKIII
jgi:hypothetical protein